MRGWFRSVATTDLFAVGSSHKLKGGRKVSEVQWVILLDLNSVILVYLLIPEQAAFRVNTIFMLLPVAIQEDTNVFDDFSRLIPFVIFLRHGNTAGAIQ